ncbi:MAG: potassium channel family protein [Burkholderiaceae bacterium]|nr:potassium channel family protein [Burkholderiaceae bacterium]
MRPPFASTRYATLSRCQRVEWVALVATIPAFYMAMLSVHRPITMLLYGLACGASAFVIWREAGQAWRTASRSSIYAHHQLGLLLASALLLSAALPAGESMDVLGVRLATAVLVLMRLGESLQPRLWRGGLPYLLTLAIGVLGLCGLGFWLLEPRAQTFGDGLWLAFTTAATVGYGDIVPSTPEAKIFAVFVVLMGFAVLSTVTASIAAKWVQSEERRIEREILHDLHLELKTIRDELTLLRDEQRARVEPHDGASTKA